MIWQGSSLLDAPTTASVADGELRMGAQKLRLTSEDPTDVRAFAPDGSAYRLRKAGFTVARYEATCDARAYTARRTRGARRDITDSSGRVVAVTHGRADGSLEVHPVGDPTPERMRDLVFITWGLTYVDCPTRRTMH